MAVAVVVALAAMPSTVAAELLAVGDAFPSWELRDHNGALAASSELAGKRYLVWFYPKAMTPG